MAAIDDIYDTGRLKAQKTETSPTAPIDNVPQHPVQISNAPTPADAVQNDAPKQIGPAFGKENIAQSVNAASPTPKDSVNANAPRTLASVTVQEPPKQSYLDAWLDNNAPETAQEAALREKREKRNKMWTSIADGISAIGNIVGAGRGARNGNPNGVSLTGTYQNRLDKMREDRKRNADRYMRYQQIAAADKDRQQLRDYNNARFVYQMQHDADEANRDQSNKDREYNRVVSNDAINAEIKGNESAERKRHNQVVEGQGAQKIGIEGYNASSGRMNANANMIRATKSENKSGGINLGVGSEYGAGVTPKNAKSIRIPNHDGTTTTYYYNKELDQALVGHKNDMLSIAKRLQNSAQQRGDNNSARIYGSIYRKLRDAKTANETLNLIASNLPNFPQLGDAVKRTLGINAQSRQRAQQRTDRSQPLNSYVRGAKSVPQKNIKSAQQKQFE